jgi:hypothetical protein
MFKFFSLKSKVPTEKNRIYVFKKETSAFFSLEINIAFK